MNCIKKDRDNLKVDLDWFRLIDKHWQSSKVLGAHTHDAEKESDRESSLFDERHNLQISRRGARFEVVLWSALRHRKSWYQTCSNHAHFLQLVVPNLVSELRRIILVLEAHDAVEILSVFSNVRWQYKRHRFQRTRQKVQGQSLLSKCVTYHRENTQPSMHD